MSDTLMSALRHLEQRWVDLGMDTSPLRPGLTAEQIRDQLAQVGMPPHPALIDWFSWHDGTDDLTWLAIPCSMGPLTLDRALGVRLAYMEPVPDDTIGFAPTWCPILGGLSTDTIVLDSLTGELRRVDAWNAEDQVRPTGSDLFSAVEFYLSVLDVAEVVVTGRLAHVPRATLPEPLRRSPLL